ncbi:hypothetical protein CR203_03970 [Salipaludibacillus neizhouensis]|uniref:Uncharacterized protein n=1 Tax=Salipaludibacillus neizhouensis TaxID=885475 RepID=A0A3A9KC34_9BACI|nr:hypothetical protein CR203_03970 [Salipaludibacillus neizhouensis]
MWLVTQISDSKQKGYFKNPTLLSKRYTGPLAANEYISFKLGKMLKHPVAQIELAKIKGKFGIVSIKKKDKSLTNWRSLSSRYNNVFNHVIRPHR